MSSAKTSPSMVHMPLCVWFGLFYTYLYDLYDIAWYLSRNTKYDTHWAVIESPFCQFFQITSINMYRSRSKQHMMTSWNGNAFHITGPLCRECNGHRIYLGPVVRGFGVSSYVSLNKLFDKQSICRWFETWRSREGTVTTSHFRKRVISEIIFEFAVR